MRKDEELIWMAGFFDGEGTAGCYGDGGGNYRARIAITQVAEYLLHHYARRFGGNVRPEKRRLENSQEIYVWTVGGEKAIRAVTKMLPYLRLKSKQAELLIRLWQIKKSFKRGKISREQKLRKEQWIKDRMTVLNARGLKRPSVSYGGTFAGSRFGTSSSTDGAATTTCNQTPKTAGSPSESTNPSQTG